ncbi:MAG: hypothetical protein VX289_11230 [Candidatus Poribacteria bacterium]|nr:hypothetical protein [Candidatus Poribacteria bacterium]
MDRLLSLRACTIFQIQLLTANPTLYPDTSIVVIESINGHAGIINYVNIWS